MLLAQAEAARQGEAESWVVARVTEDHDHLVAGGAAAIEALFDQAGPNSPPLPGRRDRHRRPSRGVRLGPTFCRLPNGA